MTDRVADSLGPDDRIAPVGDDGVVDSRDLETIARLTQFPTPLPSKSGTAKGSTTGKDAEHYDPESSDTAVFSSVAPGQYGAEGLTSRAIQGLAVALGLSNAQAPRLLKPVATGGCGEVWEALQHRLPRHVAVKRIRREFTESDSSQFDSRTRMEGLFAQEALVTACLEHPNIVPVYDLGLDVDGLPLLSMKLVRGRPWLDLLKEDAGLPMQDLLDRHLPTLVAMAQGVAFAHSRGVIHRDLKPAQVMVGEFGEVYLMDWGLAVVVDEDLAWEFNPDLMRLGVAPTRSSALNGSGTPLYMAPEQIEEGMDRIGTWTDVFLLGGTLFFLLTGEAPHASRRVFERWIEAGSGELRSPVERFPEKGIPEELDQLCVMAMRRDPKERIASVREFLRILQDFQTGAGRRRQSEEYLLRVQERLAAGVVGDYRLLTQCEGDLARAITLWSGNLRAQALRQEVLRLFATSALEKGDLSLARIMAERLDHQEERAALIYEVEAYEKLGELAELEARESAEKLLELDEMREREELLRDVVVSVVGRAASAARSGDASAVLDSLRSVLKVSLMHDALGPDLLALLEKDLGGE